MSETTSSATQNPPPGPPGDRGNPPLVRTVDDRVVAGVAGGVGRHFGVDPVIFRVVFAVLTLFGGLGVLLYGLSWLLMPADDQPVPLARDVLNGRHIGQAVLPIAVAGIGTGVFFSYVDDGFDGAFPLLIVAAVLLYISRAHTRRGQAKTLAQSPVAWSDGPGTAAYAEAAAGTATAPGAADAPVGGTGGPAAGPGLAPGPAPWWQRSTPEQAEPAPKKPKPRSYLAPATLSLATVAAGVMWWLDATTSVNITAQVALSVVLAILACGLLVGTFVGRGRWLVVPALVVSAMVTAVAAISVPITGSLGDQTFHPTTPAAVHSPYRMKAGDMRVDLTDLAPYDGVKVTATIGAGTVRVFVPNDARVVVHATSDAGEIRLGDDQRSSGWHPKRDTVLEPAAGGTPGGTITLDLGVGLGDVEVIQGGP
ncbi:PspC domain-containing protein [Yinghuangia seranimata]|uniref:PspC domain-containing protein n=1 Tax=Yinghuangia seranimata TaxID=408067 RepID=UPI00248AA1E4|nr:PspC domain-containing protein [Yinghuangia seranimata]MDI2126804.1 PspC domain-containing protein [Yinghuangia seranimata]